MRRLTITVLAIATGLVFAGCAAAPGTDATRPSSSQAADASRTPAPLVAAPEPTADAASAPEAAFLTEVHAELRADTAIPGATDEQLLAAGAAACERLQAGEPSDQISVIEGEHPNAGGYYPDSAVIITAARGTLCG